MGRRQQSESIDVARYGARRFDEPFWHWSVPLLVKCRLTCLRVTLPYLENFLSVLMTLLDGHISVKTVSSAACNSDFEIPAALQTVESVLVVRTQRHGLDVDKFPMFSVGWTWQGFCRDLDPCWSE